jgi:integrase
MGKMKDGQIIGEETTDGKVRYRVRVTITDPATGKRRSPQQTCNTLKEAQAVKRQWLTEVEQGTAIDRSKQTVAEMLRYWLDTYARPNVRPTTLEDYMTTINVHIIPAIGAVKVQKLAPAQVQQFYADKLAADCSPRVVQLCHMRLKQALDQAVKLGLVARNVADNVTPPRVERKEMQTWSAEQARQFLTVAGQSGYGPVWLVLIRSGMRRGEALGLRWSDVDYDASTLRIVQSVVPYKGSGLVQRPKSQSGWRTVRVAPEILDALRQHKIAQNERRLKLGAAWHDNDFIFAAANGNAIHPDNLTRDYDRLVQRAGVPRIRVHDPRHTYVTLALQAGAPVGAISKNVGHAKVSTTSDIYGHVTPAMEQQAADAVDAVFFAAV